MPTTSPLLRIPLPVAGDSDAVYTDMAASFASAETSMIGRFASSAERTTYLTAAGLGLGIRGMMCWLDSVGRYETYLNATVGWVPSVPMGEEFDSTAIYGANWDGVSPVRRVSRRLGVTVGSIGVFNAGFAVPYANGLLWCQLSAGDNTGTLGYVIPLLSGHRLTFLQGQGLSTSGSTIGSGVNIIVTYTAIGW